MDATRPEGEARCVEGFETFAHGSDVGVRGTGATLERAFEEVARALTSVVCDPARVRELLCVEIACSAPDRELLLLDWLDALVFQLSARRLLFARCEVRIDGDELRARAFGEPVDVARHEPAVEVKGATPCELLVGRTEGGGWRAQCVVDV